ncbi:MAG: hypothetical protein ACRDSK_02570 [Actinophytocola sp.]|uniref:hypothetical protein n=1 Tax=Actinophytocola sp. TaxID=1872138 RepID=UPI003D6BF448
MTSHLFNEGMAWNLALGLRCVYRALKPRCRTVHIGPDDVWRTSARQAGRRTAVVAQDHDLDNDFSVEETVAMGRLPHKGLLERDTGADRDIVGAALPGTDRYLRTGHPSPYAGQRTG